MDAMDLRAPFGMTVCGIEELAGHCEGGASHVLSILDPAWPVPVAFGAYGEHARLELRFHDVIDDVPGTVPPNEEHVIRLLAFGRSLAAERPGDVRLLVHCHAGVSRSTAAMALILAQALPQVPALQVLGEVIRIRPQAWPNLRIMEIADALLARDGDLIVAAAGIYRRQLQLRPGLAEDFEQSGRGREVAAARAAGLAAS
jgi:predicted protein tyrosine phosphatase